MIATSRNILLLAIFSALALALATTASARRETAGLADAGETRAALRQALTAHRAAEARAANLERQAARATEAVEKTVSQAAALAARIQQSEAGIAAGEARLALIERQRAVLQERLAEKQAPLVRLTAALQKFSRRPLALSVLRPGSVRELVYLRAMLSTAAPRVEESTAALRAEIDRGRALRDEAHRALTALRGDEQELLARRKLLAGLETRQRLASREARGTAAREAERALAFAEEARDLDALVERLDAAAGLRRELAALPGPILRPAQPSRARTAAAQPPAPPLIAIAPPAGYQLPVDGRTVAGFGALLEAGTRSEGLTLAPRAGAQVVAPGRGRVAFAGPYRGYGQIVIVEHDGGWTSLVTGLARVDVEVGDRLVGGSPLGIAGAARPAVTLELRRDGTPVNPLEFLS